MIADIKNPGQKFMYNNLFKQEISDINFPDLISQQVSCFFSDTNFKIESLPDEAGISFLRVYYKSKPEFVLSFSKQTFYFRIFFHSLDMEIIFNGKNTVVFYIIEEISKNEYQETNINTRIIFNKPCNILNSILETFKSYILS